MAQTTPAKPGTACLGCRRRKLKCTREPEGCPNCLKAELPCAYPAPETAGVKRKRGPYKKDKPLKERHLEDLVKYLGPDRSREGSSEKAGSCDDPSVMDGGDGVSTGHSRLDDLTQIQGGNPEDLVKDALNALTRSPGSETKESTEENGTSTISAQFPMHSGPHQLHPSTSRIFEYWHLYVTRVDPLTKVIHCPSFMSAIMPFVSKGDFTSLPPATEALLWAIYYAAVNTCIAPEVDKRFGETREVLLQRYGRRLEVTLADNYSVPTIESLQALVIYMTALRRQDSTANVLALFSLAVQIARVIGLHEDPGDKYTPFDAEMRRRLWWHLSGLESRGAEEGGARSTSIMEDRHVRLPANLCDVDLFPDMDVPPRPRTGCTEMTFVVLRFHTTSTVHQIWSLKKHEDASIVKVKQRKALEECRQHFETQHIRFLDESRPYDLLCINFAKIMLIKARLIIDHPLGQVPTKQMRPSERLSLLQASVDIIALTLSYKSIKGAKSWYWYFRDWTQWPSLAIVILELGQSTNKEFVDHAWTVLDPFLERWDRLYPLKRDEPAWDHVNTLIERARHTRGRTRYSGRQISEADVQSAIQCAGPGPSTAHFSASSSNTEAVIAQPDVSQMLPEFDAMDYRHSTNGLSEPLHALPPAAVPFHGGCAPAVVGFEGDFGSFDDLGNIDFSAFDTVFGDTSWEFSSPDTDWSIDGVNLYGMDSTSHEGSL